MDNFALPQQSAMQHSSDPTDSFSPQAEQQLDEFENAWRSGQAPRIEDYLPDVAPSERAALFQAMIEIELWWKKKSGAHASESQYLDRFPNFSDQISKVFRETRAVPADESTKAVSAEQLGMGLEPTLSFEQDGSSGKPEATKRVTTRANESLPERFGRYRITGLLGKGGFGAVYKAWDEELDRGVAIKVTHQRFAASGSPTEISDEARVVAGLDHPHIVPVYDIGRTDDGQHYVVSKLIDGQNLAAVMNKETIPPDKAVAIVQSIAAALHDAHGKGLAHRDVKPANILIDQTGTPWLTDFGLALRDEHLGTGPEFAGTLSYMSPEQVSGEGHRVDGRSDIFSLGIVLYELLTGRKPFRSDSQREILTQIKSMEVKPPRQLIDSISPELESVCLKALSKTPADRYTTAKDFSEALAAAASGTESLTGQSSTSSPSLVRWITVAVMLIVVIAGLVWQFGKGNREPASTPGELLKSFNVLVSHGGVFEDLEDVRLLRNGDSVRFKIQLSEPAYVKLMWLDPQGELMELYPIDPETGDRGDDPVVQVESPIQLDRGWPIDGTAGVETAVLLASRSPLNDLNLREFSGIQPADPSSARYHRYTATRGANSDRSEQTRGIKSETEQVNDPLLRLLERLRTQTEVAEAIAIPHVE